VNTWALELTLRLCLKDFSLLEAGGSFKIYQFYPNGTQHKLLLLESEIFKQLWMAQLSADDGSF
jgi:hypothetical protein